MATLMGPPLLPGYSLRVQLFAPGLHSLGDTPVRCFRVVTSPEVTVRQFCEEASRIHEINYGQSIAIKKVQDEEGFDITQSEILGTLFATTSIIRVVQASANPSARDSVPPSSALRFEPTTSRRRAREESSRPEDNGRTSPSRASKRQRVSSPNPDEPLPSREDGSEVAGPSNANRCTSRQKVIPDSQSQGSVASGVQKVLNSHPVRQDLPMIPETPSPSPPPEDRILPSNGQPLADGYFSKLDDNAYNEDSSFMSTVDNSSPLREASIRAQSNPTTSRTKSASYHIHRATERGASVSTAATSPLSFDQRNPVENGTSSTKHKRPSPTLPKHNGTPFRSHNEDSIYDTIVSEDEGAALLRRKTDAFNKFKNSPQAILPGLRKVNTLTGLRRTSAERESVHSPAELPFTPSSDKRRKQEQKEAEEARAAAAEAAEQRKREADEARQAEMLRIAAEQRHQREEQERLDIEAFNGAQTEINQKLIEKAAQAEVARKQRAEKEAEEARQREQDSIAREEAQEKQRREEVRLARENSEQERRERLTEKARIAAEKKNEENRLAKEKASSEATRLREEKEKIDREEREAAAAEIEEEISGSQKPTRSIASESPGHSSPALPRRTPIPPPPRPQASSTSFIPSGKKSNLKRSSSSQALRSSSPSVPRSTSRDTSYGGVNGEQARKVSFSLADDTITQRETPPQKQTRILPPGKKYTSGSTASTPKSASVSLTSSQAAQKAPPGSAIVPKPAAQSPHTVQGAASSRATKLTPILPSTRRSSNPNPVSRADLRTSQEKGTTPVPLPATKDFSRTSQERGATPVAQTKVLPLKEATHATTPKPLASKQRLKTYGRVGQKKGSAKSAITGSPQDHASDDKSDKETSNESTAMPLANARDIRSSNTTIKFEPAGSRDDSKENEDEDEPDKMDVDDDEHDKTDEDETQSHNTSPDPSRDSRSPVTFNKSPKQALTSKSRSRSPVSASSVDEEEAESEQSSSEDEETPKAAQKLSRVEDPQNEGTTSDSDQATDSDDGENMDIDDAPHAVGKVASNPTFHDEQVESPSEEASHSDIDKGSDEEDEESNEEEEPQVQVPKSSQELPPHRTFNEPTQPSYNNSKGSFPAVSKSTQDEIDRQITSSIHQARSARSSSISHPIPASTAAVKSKLGASLAGLAAANSSLIHSHAAKANGIVASAQKLKLAQQEEEEESEEESEDDDESSEEEMEVPKGKTPALKTSKTEDSQKDSDDSDSDSDLDFGSSVDDEERTRRDLFKQISAVANPKDGSESSFPSPQLYRSGTRDVGKTKKVEKKSSGKYLTGYLFNQPA